MRTPSETCFVTGGLGALGREIVLRLLRDDPQAAVVLLVRPEPNGGLERRQREWNRFLAESGEARSVLRTRLVAGDVRVPNLGMAVGLAHDLRRRVTRVLHCAADIRLHQPAGEAWKTNALGTWHALAFASLCSRLENFLHVSTAHVAGDREGVIREAELECGQRFLNAYEWSKFNAERLLRAASGHVPVTVVRPSIVVGDSADGHIACFSTIYEPLRRIAEGRVRRIPGRAEVPLDIVPLDHVAEVAARLVARSGADLRTYHLTSGPEGAIPVGDLVDRAIRWAAARGFAARGEPARFVDRARSRRTGLQVFFDYLWHAKAFDTAALRAALPDGLPSCPNVRDYLDTLLDYHWRSVGQSAGAAVAAGGAR